MAPCVGILSVGDLLTDGGVIVTPGFGLGVAH